MSPPDRDASLAALRAVAPGAFGFLLERGYDTSDAPDGVDFAAVDRRLRVRLRDRRDPRYHAVGVLMAGGDGDWLHLEQLSAHPPPELAEIGDNGVDISIEDAGDVAAAVETLARRVLTHFGAYLDGPPELFAAVVEEQHRARRRAHRAIADADLVQAARAAFERRDYAAVARAYERVEGPLRPPDLKRFEIARARR